MILDRLYSLNHFVKLAQSPPHSVGEDICRFNSKLNLVPDIGLRGNRLPLTGAAKRREYH